MAGLSSRDPIGLDGEPFDLIVVGGGIYGSTLALEAARRGMRPLLVERDDFGQHTSANSFRILHGGLRYLQTLNLRRFFESVSERRWFLRAFPDHVSPFPFLMPLYREGLRRPSILRTALKANDFLSSARNRGVRADCGISPGRILPPEEVRSLYPGVPCEGLAGGGLWHEAIMAQPQRIIMEILRWGESRGAVALNYVSAEEVQTEAGAVKGIWARDRVSGRRVQFHAPVVVNCCGPWVRDFLKRADRDLPRLFHRSLAINLYLDCPPDFEVGLGVSARGRGEQTYFLYPWRDGVMAGTYHVPSSGISGRMDPSRAHVEAFLGRLRDAVPSLGASADRVLHVQWGELPVVKEGTVGLSAREIIHEHGRAGGPEGLLSVSGVKFTVARRVAVRVLRRLRRRGLLPNSVSPADSPPPSLPTPTLAEALGLMENDPDRLDDLVRRIIETESVLHIEDLLLRRMDWGARGTTGAEGAELVSRARKALHLYAPGQAEDTRQPDEGFPESMGESPGLEGQN